MLFMLDAIASIAGHEIDIACKSAGHLRQCELMQYQKCAVHTTMGLVGCMARLLTDMRWPLKVLARLSALTSTAGKLNPATGLLLTPPCTHMNG